VHRKEAAEPYVLPFKSDHPRHVFTNIIDAALMRAMLYSSTLSEFNEEPHTIKLMFLYNALVFLFSFAPIYSTYIFLRQLSTTIHLHSIHEIFTNNIIISTIIPFSANEKDFMFVRDHLLNEATATQHQSASRIAKTIDPNTTDTVDDPLVKKRLGTNSKWISNLIIHYTHEQRLQTYKKEIHQLWNETFTNTPVLNTKLIIGNRNSRNVNKTLVHRRPQYTSLSKPTHDGHQNSTKQHFD